MDKTYWTYKLDDLYWNQLEQNFNKKQFRLSSFKVGAVSHGDVVLIFRTHKNSFKTGFVAVAKIETGMQHNEQNIKIFNDKNMNKFYCELQSVFIFDEVLQLAGIKKQIADLNVANLRRTAIGDNTMFVKLNDDAVKNIIPIIIDCIPVSDSDESEHDEISDDNINNNEDKDELGHFPILFDPCEEFEWGDLESFKNHFEHCEQCASQDNNEISVSTKFNTFEFEFKELKKDLQIEKLFEYYHTNKRYANTKSTITINLIKKSNNLYNGCCLILW